MATGKKLLAGGIDTYYEEHGSGEPALLLHGGFSNASDFAGMVPLLAERFHLIVPERRGHGHTPDVEGPLTYAAMAADTVAFIDALGLESAHLVGYSDGANVAMLVALSDPARVRKMVLISGNARADGVNKESRAYLRDVTAETMPPVVAEEYEKLSPDGAGHFPVIFEKTKRMLLNEPSISSEALARITLPTLVMCADDDIIDLDHTLEIYRSISDAQLCVVPGASHLLTAERPELVATIVGEFLAATETSKIEMF